MGKDLVSALLRLVLLSTIAACHANFLKDVPSSRMEPQEKVVPAKKKAIVLLHGIWSAAACFLKTEQQLRASLSREIAIISLTECATSSRSIAQQAARLQEELLARGMHRDAYKLILLGQSQGGLRGYKFYQEFGEQFDIAGLITMGAPWEGAPAATVTKETVNAYLNSLVMGCCLACARCVYPSSRQLTPEFVATIFDRYLPTHEPGVQDLVPNSTFLRNVAASLEGNQLHILAIAGSNGKVTKVLPHDTTYARYIRMLPPGTFNSAYAYIFTGRIWEKHDMMVPLASQLAQNTLKNNTFETYMVPDAIHDFLPGLSIPADKVFYNHPAVIEQAVGFIKRHFKL